MKHPYFSILCGVLFCLCFSACKSTQPIGSSAESGKVEFAILQLNDVYEISPLDNGRVGGMARVAHLRQELLKKTPHVITVHAGDFLSPSLIGSIKDENGERIAGAQMVAAMNALGVSLATFGNHEFDLPRESLQKRINESEFTWISSNVLEVKDGKKAPFQQEIAEGRKFDLPKSVIIPIMSPNNSLFKLGFIGLTLPFTQQPYLHYEDVYSSARLEYLKVSESCDAVIGITHLSREMDEQLARRVPEIPLLIGGHEHTDTLFTKGKTLIAKADANARTVYVHWCTYDFKTQKLDIWSQLIPITEDFPEEPKTAKVVNKWNDFVNDRIRAMGYEPDDVIYTPSAPLDGRESMIRTQETNLGKLITASMLAAAPEAELAILNSGSIRVDDVIQGQLIQKDILRTLPFGGDLVLGKIPGAELQKILAIGLEENVGEGGYLQTAKVSKSGNQFLIDGKALVPSKTYPVVLTGFLAKGLESNLGFMNQPDWYTSLELKGVDGQSRNDLRDVVIQYLKQQ